MKYLTILLSLCLLANVSSAQLRWVNYTGTAPSDIIIFQFDTGDEIMVCMVNHDGGMYPGEYVDGQCYFEYMGQELEASEFMVLVESGNAQLGWEQPVGENVPTNAFVAGSENGQPFYIGRMDYPDRETGEDFTCVGKVHLVDGDLVLSFTFDGIALREQEKFYVLQELSSSSTTEEGSNLDSEGTIPDSHFEDEGGGGIGIWPILLLAALSIGAFFIFRKKKSKPLAASAATSAVSSNTVAKAPKKKIKKEPTVASKDDVLAIKLMVSEDRTDEAIDKLLHLLKEKSSDYFNQIILFNSQLNELDRKLGEGTISRDQEGLERNRIKKALLNILDDLSG